MSTQIPLKIAFNLLEQCSVVINDEQVICYPGTNELTGEPDNEFMFLKWEDEGRDFCVKFAEKGNEEVEVIDSCTFVLVDTDGEDNLVTLLSPWDISEFINKNATVTS